MKQLNILYTEMSDVIPSKRSTSIPDISISDMNNDAFQAIGKCDIWFHRHHAYDGIRFKKIHKNKIEGLKTIIAMFEDNLISSTVFRGLLRQWISSQQRKDKGNMISPTVYPYVTFIKVEGKEITWECNDTKTKEFLGQIEWKPGVQYHFNPKQNVLVVSSREVIKDIADFIGQLRND